MVYFVRVSHDCNHFGLVTPNGFEISVSIGLGTSFMADVTKSSPPPILLMTCHQEGHQNQTYYIICSNFSNTYHKNAH